MHYPVNDAGDKRRFMRFTVRDAHGRPFRLLRLRFGRDRRLLDALLCFYIEESECAKAVDSFVSVAVVANVERGLFRQPELQLEFRKSTGA